jgi:hypothetical protein
MRYVRAATSSARSVVPLAALLLAATACSSDSEGKATDPGRPGAEPSALPTPAIVMDVERPELCTGPIAESWPPQCSGPAIREWRWSDFEGDFERVGDVRWGEFVIEGYLDGDEFVVTSAEPVEHSYS